MGVDADVRVATPGGTSSGRVVLVPPDLVHAVDAPGPVFGVLVDPEEHPGARAAARDAGRSPRVLDGRAASRVEAAVRSHRASLARPEVLAGLSSEILAALCTERGPLVDRRVLRALEALRDPDVPRGALVTGSGVSEVHLQALFVRDVGVPIRRYRLWRRVMAGVLGLRARDATRAAHDAGFADAAHFSRACRGTLGYTPTQMRAALASR